MENITELYCFIDDFFKDAEAKIHGSLLNDGRRHRRRSTQLSLAELMTLVVLFHQLRCRQFKAFYLYYACFYLSKEFPNLPSYSRCVELLPRCALALDALLDSIKGKCTGISITDSTPLAVCDNLRIGRHKVFDGMAKRGKSSTGGFFGFKLHMIIHHLGEITRLRLTLVIRSIPIVFSFCFSERDKYPLSSYRRPKEPFIKSWLSVIHIAQRQAEAGYLPQMMDNHMKFKSK